MADISIIADYSSVKAANKEILKVGSSAQKAAAIYTQAFKVLDSEGKKQLRLVRNQISFSQKMERQKAREAKVSAAAAQLVAKEEERLRHKFVQGYTAMDKYSKEMNDLAMARKKDLISAKEQTLAVAELNKDLAAGTGIFATYGNGLTQGRNKMSKFGMVSQQVGYQVGDFFVQVQSGQNALVAFAQQGTQLAGLIPGLGGAIVGIGLSFAAMAYQMLRGKDKAKEAAEGIEGAFEKLPDFFESLGVSISKPFAEAFAEIETKYGAMIAALAELKLKDTKAALVRGFEEKVSTEAEPTIPEKFGSVLGEFTAALTGGADAAEAIKEEFNAQVVAVEKVKEAYASAVQSATSMEDILGLSRNTLVELENISPEVAEEFLRVQDAAGITEAMIRKTVDAEEERLAVNEEISDVIRGHRDHLRDVSKTTRDILKDVNIELYLQQAILKYGEDSIQVAEKKARLEGISKGLTEENLDAYVKTVVETHRVNQQIESSANSAQNLADALKDAVSAMSSLAGFSGSLDKALTVSIAKVQALKAGANEVVAGTVAGMRSELESRISATSATGVDRSIVEAMYGGDRAKISQLEASLSEEKKLQAARTAANKTAPKGATSETGLAAAEKLLREAEAKSKVVGLTQEQAYYEELLFKMQEGNAKKRDPLTQAELKGYADKIHAIQEQTRVSEEAAKQQQALADVIGSSMETAMMGIVAGTVTVKEAFRVMALDIVKHLYKVLVVQTMIRAIGGSIGGPIGTALSTYGSVSADGNVFSGGNVQAYANGGVVGGPTTFPMAGGKTGLMGEAGPEAIMPLKRGANGKLGVQMEGGGGDTINVVQNFNFQANGDATIKQLIAQAAPKIAQMTKSSLLDDRRRGGSTKAAFG